MFLPTIFFSRGSESEISEKLKRDALKTLLDGIFYEYFTDERGKPCVRCSIPVGISVTHSSGVVAVGVFPTEPVGIDMEKIEEAYPERVADRFFKSEEKEKLHSAKDFYTIWCRKESFVKMTGEGIGALSSFNSENTNVVLTDLGEKFSTLLGEDFAFCIASHKIFHEIKFIEKKYP